MSQIWAMQLGFWSMCQISDRKKKKLDCGKIHFSRGKYFQSKLKIFALALMLIMISISCDASCISWDFVHLDFFSREIIFLICLHQIIITRNFDTFELQITMLMKCLLSLNLINNGYFTCVLLAVNMQHLFEISFTAWWNITTISRVGEIVKQLWWEWWQFMPRCMNLLDISWAVQQQ